VLIFTARRAGISPARTPETTRIRRVVKALWNGTSGSRNISPGLAAIARAIASTTPTPATRPRYPASVVSTSASKTICPMTVSGVAPTARRMPISLVRSRTMTSMMLLTPMTPAASVPMPTIQTSARIPVNSPVIWLYSISEL